MGVATKTESNKVAGNAINKQKRSFEEVSHLRVVRYFLFVFYALKVDDEMLHRLFLIGLKKHGKGDWTNISRNFVMTRTPTQVASHAQKYFIRQLSGAGGKDKRRASTVT
ncbi:hypothetical protein K1719_001520 [Acacia pycnantha]|nr:hypothetical protein K1719_001520 [Acacia pycnantha]